MIRNLKALGLAMVAVFAMSALVASAAQATVSTFTPEKGEAATIHGVQSTTHNFQVGSRTLTCGTATFLGSVTGNTTDTKIVPTYENCDTKPVLGISFPAVVTMNSCYYTFTGENTVATGQYGVSVHVECDSGDEIVIHVKSGSNDICTLTIKPQTATGLTATNDTSTKPDDVVLHANSTVQTTIHGTLCGGTENTNQEFNSVYTGDTTIKAYHGAVDPKNQVDLTVSD
jgi:hypothetical protein